MVIDEDKFFNSLIHCTMANEDWLVVADQVRCFVFCYIRQHLFVAMGYCFIGHRCDTWQSIHELTIESDTRQHLQFCNVYCRECWYLTFLPQLIPTISKASHHRECVSKRNYSINCIDSLSLLNGSAGKAQTTFPNQLPWFVENKKEKFFVTMYRVHRYLICLICNVN